MSKQQEAMRLALEALEYYQHRRLEWDYSDEVAITALKTALAEPVQEPVQEPVAWTLTKTLDKRETTTNGYLWFSDPVNSSWTPLYTAPPQRSAEPVQEPVAWSYELATTMLEHGYDGWEHRITRYKPNVPEGSIRNLTPLYTAPPQRKPLTEEELWSNDEIMSLNADLGWHMETIRMFARAIERAHGIT